VGTVSDVPGMQQEKAVLRTRLLKARSALTADGRREAGRLIRDALLSLPELQMAGTVAAYYSVGAEPDTRGLVYALWKRGTYVLLPLLQPNGDLDWASYEGPDSLIPGPRGLQEPKEKPRGPEAIVRADVVLVPALAVDHAGNRLGRGGGSYDRALARVVGVGTTNQPQDEGRRDNAGSDQSIHHDFLSQSSAQQRVERKNSSG